MSSPDSTAPAAVEELLVAATVRLLDAGVPSPRVDAELLLAHASGRSRASLPFSADVDRDAAVAYERLVRRRCDREPLHYLTGTVGFRYLDVAVGPGVFVPRPETELLAGWAVDAGRAAARERRRDPRLVDLCTGSGAVAAALASEVPGSLVHAVELDPAAHAWAERNLEGTGVDLRRGDLADAFDDLDGSVDVVVCNPPYVPLVAYDGVDVEARTHEPGLALFSGDDGLDAVRVLERTAARLLRPGGRLGFEHASEQATSAPAVLHATGRWDEVLDHDDLAGRPRWTTARLRG